jgi:hypothetical protein
LHRYGRRRDVVSRDIYGRGNVFMMAAVSSPWCRFDPDDSLLSAS